MWYVLPTASGASESSLKDTDGKNSGESLDVGHEVVQAFRRCLHGYSDLEEVVESLHRLVVAKGHRFPSSLDKRAAGFFDSKFSRRRSSTVAPPPPMRLSRPEVGMFKPRLSQRRRLTRACWRRRVKNAVDCATTAPPELARELFAPIAPTYERWARLLSFGQDARWRQAMVDGLGLSPGSRVLDVAAGTGSMTRLLKSCGLNVLSVDQSREMILMAKRRGAAVVLATADRLPFADHAFDGVTFGYLLRYVDDVPRCLEELVRVVRPGGMVGMVEFGRPNGAWRPAWWLYTRTLLPMAGAAIRSGWWEVGRFLGPSIGAFARRHPPERLAAEWGAAGMEDVRFRRMSLGGGIVMWGRRR